MLNEEETFFHVAGGSSEDGRVEDAWRRGLDTDAWEPRAGLPESIFRSTAVRHGNDALVFAGTASGGDESNRLYRWSLGEGTWTQVSAGRPPGGRYKAAAAMAGALMVVHGGRTNDSGEDVTLQDVWVFDPADDTWTEVNTNGGPGPMTRQGLAWDSQREMLWMHGGIDQDDVRHDWLWSLDLTSGVWAEHEVGGDTPGVRASHTFLEVEGKLLVWGGTSSDDSTWFYDPDTEAWTQHTHETAPSPRDAQVADVTSDGANLYLMGGDPAQDLAGDFVADFWQLDLASMVWTERKSRALPETSR
jgi:N-acetylneuraminic acid mutarotase